MSNLNLPDLSFQALKAGRTTGKVAYATRIEFVGGTMNGLDDFFVLYHHDTAIAQISETSIYLTNAGWDSMTTLSRLNKVAADNNLPVRVSKRNHAASLLNRATLKVERTFEQLGYGITFTRSPIAPAGWARKADNKLNAFA